MVMITIWKWKDLDEEGMVQAMGATQVLDYPEGYENYLFTDGSGGVTITPDGESAESEAFRSFVFGKWCALETHRAMTQGEALGVGPKVVELLRNLNED